MAIKTSRYKSLKRDLSRTVLSQALMLLGHSPGANYRLLGKAFDRIAKTEHQKMIAGWLNSWLMDGNPGSAFFHKILAECHPNVRKYFLANSIVSLFFRDQEVYDRIRAEHGFNPPSVMLVSPTMRCNYKCVGCYASEYTRQDDLPYEDFDRVLTEAEELGIRFFVILGGEPFIYPGLLDIFKKHRNSTFQPYTNGSLIDEKMATQLAKLGNVSPQVSVDGFEMDNDALRGECSFERAMSAMDNLKKAGCVFGFSTRVTKHNVDAITSDDFIDLMVEKGALYGWYFLYIPVGRNPTVEDMPTPEQRNQLRKAVNHFRKTRPILPVDFWNDGPLTAGCINAGRIYFHVNHKGDVEPCIFVHYATHNVKTAPLAEALKSPFFAGLRRMQPFSYNTLLPCPIIDHPEMMRAALHKWGAYPTHEGAEKTFTELAPELNKYSAEVHKLYDDIWQEEYGWAEKWMTVMDHPPERVATKRRAYYLRKKLQAVKDKVTSRT